MHSAIKIAKKLLDLSGSASDMTPMKLIKLVYIAHGWMLGLYGRPLISEDVEAWKYGPVIPEVYREIKKYGATPVKELPEEYSVALDSQEENVIQQVYEKYIKFDGLDLSAMTHAPGTPWHEVWHSAGYQTRIDNEKIKNYYRKLSGNVQ